MKDKFVQQNGDDRLAHFLENTKGHFHEALAYHNNIKRQFVECLAKEGMTTAILSAYKALDDVIADGIKASPHPISCINCTAAHCCHQNVEVCEAEVKVIGIYCKEKNINIPRDYLQQQLRYSRQDIGNADCSACVFLKGNRCSIYPVRPMNCRAHLVATPAEHCDLKKHKGQKISMLPIPSAEIIMSIVFNHGGKAGRLPRMLIKLSK